MSTIDPIEATQTPDDVAAAAFKFIDTAFDILRADRTIPTARNHFFLHVGRDYFGPDLMYTPAFQALEGALQSAYPERFDEPLAKPEPEFPNAYIFSLLEACIAQVGLADAEFDAAGPQVKAAVAQLLTVLATEDYVVRCARVMSHLTTHSGATVTLNDIYIIPEPAQAGTEFLRREIRRLIPGAPGSYNREPPTPYDPPHSILTAQLTTSRGNPFTAFDEVSSKLERFVLLLRLLTGATAQSAFEVQGASTLVSRVHPQLRLFPQTLPMMALVRRTARVRNEDARAFQGLGALIDAVEVKREKMASTSFDVAVSKFHSSFGGDQFSNVVDLATALEAILLDSSDDTEAITLRLKTRAAALLVTDKDSSRAIFDDVGSLYWLRSRLVHGGDMKESALRGKINSISTVPESNMFGIATAQAVDRLRDLVRRALLARICLASGESAVWRFDRRSSVDSELADEATRAAWREQWHATLASFGAESAANHLTAPVDFVSRDDR